MKEYGIFRADSNQMQERFFGTNLVSWATSAVLPAQYQTIKSNIEYI